MARLARNPSSFRHRIAVVDDDLELARSTMRLFEHEGHEVRCASTPAGAIELIRSWRPHLVLLDYYMEGGTGADVVRAIREFDPLTQVLLVTGYASEQPARVLLAELDIQGFHDKADGPQRLMILADAALKHYRSIERVDRQRRHLHYILDVSREVSRLQPAQSVCELALARIATLLADGTANAGAAPSGLFARIDQASGRVGVDAAIGRYAGAVASGVLPDPVEDAVRAAAHSRAPFVRSGLVVLPFTTRCGDTGCAIVEAPTLPDDAVLACRLYLQQVLQALENVELFERATVDPLTTLYRRDFGLQRLDETLRLGWRTMVPTSAILLDLDHFKQLNDTYGHAAGDLFLCAVGQALLGACRTTDIISRHGGEEILIVLPATDHAGAAILADRLRAAIADVAVEFEGQRINTSASLGVATSGPGQLDRDELVRRADRRLYEAKRGGRNRVCCEQASEAA